MIRQLLIDRYTLHQRAKLAVIIVSYGNPTDVERCLRSLSRSSWGDYEIFICENAGQDAFTRLNKLLTREDGPLEQTYLASENIDKGGGRLAIVVSYRFRSRDIRVRLAAGRDNLGYAGGVNAWLERLMAYPGWEAVLVLNPDTEVNETCLSELMAKAAEGFGMVGGTIVFDDSPDKVINYGLVWSRVTGRISHPGRNSPAESTPSHKLLSDIDAISGACVLVTREFINDVGFMVEDYFLYMEDLDWGRRRGKHRIGFAPKAVIRHVGGTSIGLYNPKGGSSLSIYLSARNSILYARRWAGWFWILHFGTGLLHVVRYVFNGAPGAASIALAGLMDGARGYTGRPDMLLYRAAVHEEEARVLPFSRLVVFGQCRK